MQKFYNGVVNCSKLIIIAVIVLFIACLACSLFVSVNYDMNDYLPGDSASVKAFETMEEEYGTGIPNARVMVSDVTIAEALEYKQLLYSVNGVTDVMWLDDAANVVQPLDFIDKSVLDTYYKDNNALFSVTIDENSRIEAVNEIRAIIGDDNAMSGSAVSTAAATESTVKEIPLVAIFGVLFALIILLLTTTSWAEPFIILIGLGVAVLINMGSNIIFGEVSFVTYAAGNILQLAVSLDYSVFLLHRFEECRKETSNAKKAMVKALCGSTLSILSSGLTTIIGFLALCLMRFRIGPDLGLALAKGIVISLLTVFLFMPVFILSTYKLIDKTRHRSFMPSFKGFGKFVSRIMIVLVCIFVIVILPAYLASNSSDFYYGASHIFGEETKLGQDAAKIEETFGQSDTYVLMIPKESLATQKELSDALHAMPEVTSILSYVDTVGSELPEEYLDDTTLSMLNSENYTRMVISLSAAYEGEETFELIEQIRDTAQRFYPDEWLLAGEGVSTLDLKDTVTSDMVKVNLVAIGAVFVVLLLTMRSIVLPILLVLGIETAIWVNLAIPYFTDKPIFYIAYLIISSIQLGATVDYAILFTDRFREFRIKQSKKEAIISTISTVTVSIMTSGIVMTVVGFLLGILSSHGVISQLGMLLGRGTICSLVIALLVLPGLLYIFDRMIRKLKREDNISESDKEDIINEAD